MNGIGTGLILIALGLLLLLPVYISSRRTGSPFLEKNIIGGYNGVVGLGSVVIGVLIIVISAIALVVG